MNNEMICANDVALDFSDNSNTFRALDGINLSVDRGEIVSIMGPSGCGKSSLLKILAGIERCTKGTVRLCDTDVTEVFPDAIKRNIGYVFQDKNLLYWRTVKQNLMLPLEMFDLNKKKEYLDRIDTVLDMVGLLEFKNIYPRELSGGMQQRVGLARALLHNPTIMLMDGPFSALDAITKEMLYFEFLKIFREANRTILLITNSIEEALIFSNRVLLMSSAPGKIVDELHIDIPYEKRVPGIENSERYKQLYAELIKVIKEDV